MQLVVYLRVLRRNFDHHRLFPGQQRNERLRLGRFRRFFGRNLPRPAHARRHQQPQQHHRQPDTPLPKKSAAKPVRLGQCHAKECPRRRFPESANRFCWHIPHKPRARQTPQRRTQRTHRLSRRNSRQCRPRRKAAQRRAHAEQHSTSQRPRVKRQGHNAVDIHHRQPA